MKMLKKLLAVVLTGAMALTLLTACGGNAVVRSCKGRACGSYLPTCGDKRFRRDIFS